MAIPMAAMTIGIDDSSGALSATMDVPTNARASTGVTVIVSNASARAERRSDEPLACAISAIDLRVSGLKS